jgi:hypothetical protein
MSHVRLAKLLVYTPRHLLEQCLYEHDDALTRVFMGSCFLQKWRACLDAPQLDQLREMQNLVQKIAIPKQEAILDSIARAVDALTLGGIILDNFHHDEVAEALNSTITGIDATPLRQVLSRIAQAGDHVRDMLEVYTDELVRELMKLKLITITKAKTSIEAALTRVNDDSERVVRRILPRGQLTTAIAVMRTLDIPYCDYTGDNVNTTGKWERHGNFAVMRGYFHGRPTVCILGWGDHLASDVLPTTHAINTVLSPSELKSWLEAR